MSDTKFGKLVSVAAGVLFVAAVAVAVEEPKLPYKLSFSIQTGEAESNQVTIDPKGIVTTSIAYSVPGSSIRAIGRSSLAAGPTDPDLVAIGKRITDNGLATGRAYSAQKEAGVLYLLLDIEQDGKETKYVISAGEPVPDALEAVVLTLTELMSRAALKAPQRTVSIHPEFDPEAAAAGGRTRLTLDIRNAGPSRADLPNFAGFRQGGAGELKVDLWIPPARKGDPPTLVSTLDLTGKEWHVADGTSLRPKDPYLKLQGPGSLRVWTEVRVPEAVPGALSADLVYHARAASEAERGNDGLVVGLFRADPVTLTIVPRPAR